MYEWDGREEELYRLYVEEKKPLDEVMQYMKDTHGFAPSKRAYQTQFKRWDFPSKQNPAHKNAPLVERTRQLWEANTSQKDMLRILTDEGFSIKERELMRVRSKNRWLLRLPNGVKMPTRYTTQASAVKDDGDTNHGKQDSENVEGQIQELIVAENEKNNNNNQSHGQVADARSEDQLLTDATLPLTSELAEEVRQKRALRLEQLQAESEDRYASKKRRRRTRGWAGMPADPPAPPRFPSETTLDESKAYLHLDNNIYREIRDQFMNICQDAGFFKKTLAGPERWEEAKSRLIQDNPHLNRQFNGPFNGVPMDSKKLALDVVCTDVTKRMRTLAKRMTVAEAKTILGVNPAQSREIRNDFYEVLKEDHFTSKLEAGEEHWRELKQMWLSRSPVVQRILEPSEADHPGEKVLAEKHHAAEVLCRDVMKRLRDEQTKLDPSRKKQVNHGPGPGPAPPRIPQSKDVIYTSDPQMSSPSKFRSGPAPQANMVVSQNSNIDAGDLQIDPTLLAAVASPASANQSTSSVFDQLRKFAASAAASEQQIQAENTTMEDSGTVPSLSNPVPALIRLSEESQFQTNPGGRFWAGIVTSTSIGDLTQLVLKKYRNATVQRVDAVVIDSADGNETFVTVESDEALKEYFQKGVTGNATFSVVLA